VWGTATIAGTIGADASFDVAGPGGSATKLGRHRLRQHADGKTRGRGAPATGGGGGALQGEAVAAATRAARAAPCSIHRRRSRGGCAAGGGGAGTGIQGPPGAGGGALQITARVSITVAQSANCTRRAVVADRVGYRSAVVVAAVPVATSASTRRW
jgi:hypothetical protein